MLCRHHGSTQSESFVAGNVHAVHAAVLPPVQLEAEIKLLLQRLQGPRGPLCGTAVPAAGTVMPPAVVARLPGPEGSVASYVAIASRVSRGAQWHGQ